MSKDWNAAYEMGDMPWDKGEAAPPLREFLKRTPISGRVLVPGCGLGHDVRLLAKEGALTVGLDLAVDAVRRAKAIPANRNASFELGNFLKLSNNYHGQFDYVVEHTCLCALDREQRVSYAQSVGLALKPGGLYLAIFYRVVKGYNGDGPPHPITAEEIEALFGADFEILERVVPQETYPSRPVGCEELCLMRKRS